MGFFDRLFSSKGIFDGNRNPILVCELTLCGQKYILSEFDLNYDVADKEYFEAYVAFSDPINAETESWITRSSRKETGVIKFYRNDDSMAEGALFELKFEDASCIHYRNSTDGDQPVKMITITIPHIYMAGEEFDITR